MSDTEHPITPLPRWAPLPGDPPYLRRELAQWAAEHQPQDIPLPPEPQEGTQ